jgi:hypothetical protein
MTELIKMVKNIDSASIHQCPYNFIDIKNKPFLIDTFPSIFPQGDYRMNFNLTNRQNNDIISSFEIMISWFSSERHSFG